MLLSNSKIVGMDKIQYNTIWFDLNSRQTYFLLSKYLSSMHFWIIRSIKDRQDTGSMSQVKKK